MYVTIRQQRRSEKRELRERASSSSLRAENRPEHFSRGRGRSDASPKTIPDLGFPARADSADETYAFVALLPAILCRVRMNPFILCPGGPNGSSAAQIELREQILTRRGVQALVSGGLGQDGRR